MPIHDMCSIDLVKQHSNIRKLLRTPEHAADSVYQSTLIHQRLSRDRLMTAALQASTTQGAWRLQFVADQQQQSPLRKRRFSSSSCCHFINPPDYMVRQQMQKCFCAGKESTTQRRHLLHAQTSIGSGAQAAGISVLKPIALISYRIFDLSSIT